MIYATEFGCDPTGQTPCAAQMQQFLNAVRGKEGRIPPGTYKIESELYFGYDCSAGSRPSSLDALGGRLIGGGCANTALLWAGTTGSTPSAVLRVSNPRCYVEGIKVAPLGTNKPDVGLVFQDAEQAVVKDVWVYNTAEGSSLAASQVQAGFLWDTTWKASNTTVPTNVDMRLVGCEAESCWRGYFMRTSARAQGVMLECCSAKANGGHGFHVFGTSLAMYFCRAKQNGGHALRVGISGTGIAITSQCTLQSNRFDDVASSTLLSSEERKHIVYFENAQYNIMVGGAGQFLEPSNPPGGDYIGAADNLQNVVLYPATGLSSRLPRTSTSPGLEFQFCPGGTAADGDSRIIRWTNQGSGVIDLDFESL